MITKMLTCCVSMWKTYTHTHEMPMKAIKGDLNMKYYHHHEVIIRLTVKSQ